ncbi:MAG: hypothetical protein DRQ51_00665 [Gammaproteobacteria bacterium]|nr:MAG: hypothetical protein DRQ51_00665 [Gammaproteobacteria bacterium]
MSNKQKQKPIIKNFKFIKRPLHNSSTIYNNNKMRLFYQKIRQITGYFPLFLIKYALFSYYSKQHLNYAKVS